MEEGKITIEDFAKLTIRIGTVTAVEIVEGADKLYKLTVDLGEDKPRQILSAIRQKVSPDNLLDRQFPFLVNLEPRMIRGLESNGMILAAGDDESFSLLSPVSELSPGTKVK